MRRTGAAAGAAGASGTIMRRRPGATVTVAVVTPSGCASATSGTGRSQLDPRGPRPGHVGAPEVLAFARGGEQPDHFTPRPGLEHHRLEPAVGCVGDRVDAEAEAEEREVRHERLRGRTREQGRAVGAHGELVLAERQ